MNCQTTQKGVLLWTMRSFRTLPVSSCWDKVHESMNARFAIAKCSDNTNNLCPRTKPTLSDRRKNKWFLLKRLLGDKRIIHSDRWGTFTNILWHKRDCWDMSNGKVIGDWPCRTRPSSQAPSENLRNMHPDWFSPNARKIQSACSLGITRVVPCNAVGGRRMIDT